MTPTSPVLPPSKAAAEVPAAAFVAFSPSLAPPELPTLRSADGRFQLTATDLTVRSQAFALLTLERADLAPVRWLLWYLLGGLGLAGVMIAFLQNWLATLPAMAGMAATALLLAYGHRGTNRLRLHRLGLEAANFALPGETAPWQRLTAELNRRIRRVHDLAAAEAAALLAAAEAEAQALAAAEARAHLPATAADDATTSLPDPDSNTNT